MRFGNEDFNGCPKPPRHRWRENQPVKALNSAERKRGAWIDWKNAAQTNKAKPVTRKPVNRCRKCVWRKGCGDYFGYEAITKGAGCGIFKKKEGLRK